MSSYSIAVAGSTAHTALLAKALHEHPQFILPWVLTPLPRKIGRKQTLTPNPLDVFAQESNIERIFIEQKIDQNVHQQIQNHSRPDFLLVVDFGYVIPQWLLAHPHIAPVNIHPSALPKWRGSSPGQFVLLFGEKISAVSLIVMNEKLDQGDILHQETFSVQPTWNQKQYYQASFTQVSEWIPKALLKLAMGKITRTSQPETSPTPLARRLNKTDSFISWSDLAQTFHRTFEVTPSETLFPPVKLSALSSKIPDQPLLSLLIQTTLPEYHPQLILQAQRAFAPWPGLWTEIPTRKGLKKMKILELSTQSNQLALKTVQIEGKNSTPWTEEYVSN